MMAMRMKANEKIKQVFDIFDTDCDGQDFSSIFTFLIHLIRQVHILFRALFYHVQPRRETLPRGGTVEWEQQVHKFNYLQVEEMMRWADKDGDGMVGMQEFTSMMQGVVRQQNSSSEDLQETF